MRRSALLFAGIVLAATAAYSGDGNVHRNARAIPGRYIVVLESGADFTSVSATVRTFGSGRVHHTYTHGIHGLSVEMSDADARALARDARVKFVEEDASVSVAQTPWGLDRIDQHSLPLNGTYVSNETGAGVKVYVVDTGILAGHEDFAGRVASGFSALNDGNGSSDCNGHGTHVSGVIAGSAYGVAKAATLVPVRVLDCAGGGTLSSVIDGLDWVIEDHASSRAPAVVNMSIAGNASTALDMEVNSVIGAGLTTVVAAGNAAIDACGISPARVGAAITVGASTEADQRASFSNYGTCVDLFAPGTNILSDWYSSPTATAVSSGTSEAAPFVTGVAALALEKYPTASPAAVAQTVVSQATIDALAGIGTGSPNLILFSLIDALADAIGDAQLLADPSFEYGTTFWASDVCTVINPTGCAGGNDEFMMMNAVSHSGKFHATIGGPARSFHLTSETVTIPATVSRAELDLYLWIVTKDKKPAANDTLTIEIRDASGALLRTVGTFSNLDANSTYTLRRFDVSDFRGATVRISFTGTQAQGPPTWFLLDDVMLNVWR